MEKALREDGEDYVEVGLVGRGWERSSPVELIVRRKERGKTNLQRKNSNSSVLYWSELLFPGKGWAGAKVLPSVLYVMKQMTRATNNATLVPHLPRMLHIQHVVYTNRLGTPGTSEDFKQEPDKYNVNINNTRILIYDLYGRP